MWNYAGIQNKTTDTLLKTKQLKPTLPEINSLPLKIDHPQKETSMPTIHFQGLC